MPAPAHRQWCERLRRGFCRYRHGRRCVRFNRRGTGCGPGTPGRPGQPCPQSPSAIVASMSNAELTRFKRRCDEVVATSSACDQVLLALCHLINQTAFRQGFMEGVSPEGGVETPPSGKPCADQRECATARPRSGHAPSLFSLPHSLSWQDDRRANISTAAEELSRCLLQPLIFGPETRRLQRLRHESASHAGGWRDCSLHVHPDVLHTHCIRPATLPLARLPACA